MSGPSLLSIGLPSDHESIARASPKLDPQTVQSMLDKTEADCKAAGYDFVTFAAVPEEGTTTLLEALKERQPHWDGIVLGFGVRGNPEMTVWFEEIVNAVREKSPKTKFLFNTSPDSTLEAAKRNFPLSK